MNDRLYPMPVEKLLQSLLEEYKSGTLFGYDLSLFFLPPVPSPLEIQRFGKRLAAPLGLAAGPHTQLSQNIVLGWLFGARFIELKTVQVLDDIDVPKPCIDMKCEGYNSEWSQELSVSESLNEYLNAWVLIHILNDLFNPGNHNTGSLFNLSVGYDLEGIKSDKIAGFLSAATNSEEHIKRIKTKLSEVYPRVESIPIPGIMSDNVTLSTMHGCPPDEIENIAKHLLDRWNLHTTVKLNPTLLGSDILRSLLNDRLGYPITVPDEAFAHDMQYDDAVSMIKRLTQYAAERQLSFGVKLTNTLETLNNRKRFLTESDNLYMSGPPLHPLAVTLAAKLQNEFNGELDISFCGGADAFNFPDLISSGLSPVTVSSDLLKPAGYSRLPQYLTLLQREMKLLDADSIQEYIIKKSENADDPKGALRNLNRYAGHAAADERYIHHNIETPGIKTGRALTPYDCIAAPCTHSCAINQEIPGYLYFTSRGEFDNALDIIYRDNPLPHITGMVCDHLCQTKCTRMNIDASLHIREIKRVIAETTLTEMKPPVYRDDISVGIIGAGPAGLSAAFFLMKEGIPVHIYDSAVKAGGMVSNAIPLFRIGNDAVETDADFLNKMGVRFHFGYSINKARFETLREKHDYLFIAVGAAQGKVLNIPGEENANVFDQLSFLSKVKNFEITSAGQSAAVIGGGNSAIDAARTAKRLTGKDGRVSLIYRRTIQEMPADKDEINALIKEGIKILELTSPVEIVKKDDKLSLTGIKNRLGEPDESGRRRPVPIEGSEFQLSYDTIISAIGQNVQLDFLPDSKLDVDAVTLETSFDRVYAGGDAVRGADTLIHAVRDGKNAAAQIMQNAHIKTNRTNSENKTSLSQHQKNIAERIYPEPLPEHSPEDRHSFDLVHPPMGKEAAITEAKRCLYCDEICNVCTGVCPNTAIRYFKSTGVPFSIEEMVKAPQGLIAAARDFKMHQNFQIYIIADFCNQCGNCETFCPTSGAPYKTKPRFHISKESYTADSNGFGLSYKEIFYKDNAAEYNLIFFDDKILFKNKNSTVTLNQNNFQVADEDKTDKHPIDWNVFCEMYALFQYLHRQPLFSITG